MNIWSKCDACLVSKRNHYRWRRFFSRENPTLLHWKQWNLIIRLRPDENVVGGTMAVETELFLYKVQKLSGLASTLESWEPSLQLELQDIQSRLRDLSVFVKQDKCLNAGGKFEWVDSVLVKVHFFAGAENGLYAFLFVLLSFSNDEIASNCSLSLNGAWT